ncbi:MAG: hypothetical protein ACKPKO_54550, partial [Candidatus Fonsibacter sp.]
LKPKVFIKSSEQYNDQRRLDDVNSPVWWEMMNKEERRQLWRDHPDVRPADASLPSIRCHPLGTGALIADIPPITLMYLSSVEYHETDSSDDDTVDQPSNEERLYPLEWWENTIRELTDDRVVASIYVSTRKYLSTLLLSASDHRQQHIDLIGFRLCPDNTCVARLVGKSEIENTIVAKLAMQKEWDRLT